MKVKIYPIKSSLHNENVINITTKTLIDKLNSDDLYFIIEENIQNLYLDCDLSLILVQSGGSESFFLNNLKYFKEPYYILTYSNNNSLAAALEIMAYIKNNQLKGQVLHGNNSYLRKTIKKLILENKPKEYTNLGLIGKPSDWLISSNFNNDTLLNKFNINIVNIDMKEIIDLYNNYSYKNNSEIISNFKNINTNDITLANKLYFVLKEIVNKYHLKGFTIRCFDLLNSINTTACLALSKFNDDGIIAACEGDVPSMIAMYIIKNVLNKPSFQCNPCKINLAKNEILLAHCTIPLLMCTSFNFDSHYESNIGVGIHGNVKLGKATLFRLNSSFDKCFINEGTIIKNQYKDNLCRTQIICRFNNLDKLLKSPLGNHEIIILGHEKKKLLKYLNKLDIVEI